ncbi:protein O-mannosyl-transferase family [Paraliomyxa miuraensis]|uniref:protein O-mannosyl-transferase family n=1 Tax=Paraliomyxa miuraensis TaxID=376150 RepID=UPI00224FBF8E|nr:DUF2723 domain-containing protein [Paraliomyxa miuraensis]MCX4245769.1 DUF2723 domain-containing protein [Paraliomyxa miuraensis]
MTISAEPAATPSSERASAIDWGRAQWPWLALALLLLLLAALAIPHHVQAGDAGEFATVMLEGGVPHPSGYPWMRALGGPARLLRALGATPAAAAAWPCALAGVAAWLVLWPLLARLAGRAAATVAVAVLATASPVVLHVNDSEVWGPHLLACALLLRLCASSRRRPWQLGLAFGLAVSHHLSAGLMLPLVVGAAWPHPFSWRRLASVAAQGVGAGLLGLLPYATLAIGSGGPWRWGDTQSLGGLLHHVLRADYGVLELSLHAEDPHVLDQWARAVEVVGSAHSGGLAGSPLAAALVLVAIAALALRRPATVPPGPWWGLWITVLGCTLGFPAAHNIDPTRPFGAWILERFDLLTILLWAPPWAVAAARLRERVPSRAGAVVLGTGAAVLVATQLLRTDARGLPSDDAGVERYARDLLRTPAPDRAAIVIGTDDHRLFPLLFVQHVQHEGPATIYIDASLLSQPWYRQHLRTRFPALPEVDKPVRLVSALWADPALRDTPIYLANVFSRPASTLPVVPQGVLWRVLAPHRPPPDPAEVIEDHLAALRRYGEPALDHAPAVAHPWTADLGAAYNEGTRRLLAALHAEGRDAEASALLSALGPWRPR